MSLLKKKNKIITLLLLSLLCVNVSAERFNSLQLANRSLSKECLDYCITGVCFFLVCRPWGCYIVSRPEVTHNLPDLTVSAYKEPGDNPWIEVETAFGSIAKKALQELEGKQAGGGSVGQSSQGGGKGGVIFNEVQVVGNPAAKALEFSQFLCKSDVKPFYPYFASEVDAKAWRGIVTESRHPNALIPGRREIGSSLLQTWGSVYPRTGFITQSQPPKAAAVAAQRAIDITTREGQIPHLYTPYGWEGKRRIQRGEHGMGKEECIKDGGRWITSNDDGVGFCQPQYSYQWMPGSNEKTDKWQMVSPNPTNRCEAFGSRGEWSRDKPTQDSQWAWNFWRKYKCCLPGPGSHLYTISIPKICF